jgi:hypothetical protein
MTRQTLRLATLLISIIIAPAALSCDYPARVELPNGMTAEKEDMLSAQRLVKQYVADMEAYLDCIVAEEKAARQDMVDLAPEDEEQREEMLNKKYNAAVEEMERVAAAFNAEVQAYRGKNE